MGQNTQRLCLAVLPCQFLSVFDRLRIPPEEKNRSFREGPLQMGIADLLPGGAEFLSSRLFRGFHQSAVRDKILDPGETVNVMNLIEDDQTKDSSNTGDRAQTEIGIRVMNLRNKRQFMFKTQQQLVVVVQKRKIEFYVLLNTDIRKPFGNTFSF